MHAEFRLFVPLASLLLSGCLQAASSLRAPHAQQLQDGRNARCPAFAASSYKEVLVDGRFMSAGSCETHHPAIAGAKDGAATFFDRLKPDRISIGLLFPVFTNLDNLHKLTTRPEKLVSPIALTALDLKSAKDSARAGEIYFPQAELLYRLPRSVSKQGSQRMALGVKVGFTQGTDDDSSTVITAIPALPVTHVKVKTHARVGTLGLSLSYYPLLNRKFRIYTTAGVEAHFVKLRQRVRIWCGAAYYSYKRRIDHFGVTSYIGGGIEFPPWDPGDIIPDDVYLSLGVEHHFALFSSELDEDPKGTRFLARLSIPINRR